MKQIQKYDLKYASNVYRSLTFNDIVAMLSTGQVTFDSEICEAEKNSWQSLLDSLDFSNFITHKLRFAANSYSHESLFNHWYVKDGETHFGPFSFLQMLEFNYQKRLNLGHLVRHPTYASWEKFGDKGLFESRSLQKLTSCQTLMDIVTRRKHPRLRYDNEVFISHQGELFRGVSWSLSVGGLGIVTDQPTGIKVDNSVNVLVNSTNEHGAVQLKARVTHVMKEMNCERLALEFENESAVLSHFLNQRLPKAPSL